MRQDEARYRQDANIEGCRMAYAHRGVGLVSVLFLGPNKSCSQDYATRNRLTCLKPKFRLKNTSIPTKLRADFPLF